MSSSNGLRAVNCAMELMLEGADTLGFREEDLLTPESRQLWLGFYAVNARGDLGAASFYPTRFAAPDGHQGALHDTAHFYERMPS